VPIPSQVAQIVQEFGTGAFLLWPLLMLGKDIDHSRDNPPRFAIFLIGAALFFLGWFIRRVTLSRSESLSPP
jgi:glycerol uptake facilitator-like aquaporin